MNLIIFPFSGTFNYTAFYMFFGLIVSPYILFKKKFTGYYYFCYL